MIVRRTSELMFPDEMAKYIRSVDHFTDNEILDLLEAIDGQYMSRFGENPYERLMERSSNDRSNSDT